MLLKSFWLQPPSGPRERCEEFQDFFSVVVAQPLAVDMADYRRTFRAARPIAARSIFIRRESAAIRLRAGQCVVIIRRITASCDHRATLGQRGLHAQFIAGAVQIIDAFRHYLTFEVLPRARSDTITGIDCSRSVHGLGAEIGPPGLAASTGLMRESLALPVGAFQSAKIAPLYRAQRS